MRPLYQGKIRPKISTMPRQKTEATLYLDLYKLAVEKKRLVQELNSMEQRRLVIHQRLGVLENLMAEMEMGVQQQRVSVPPSPSLNTGGETAGNNENTDAFKVMPLDY